MGFSKLEERFGDCNKKIAKCFQNHGKNQAFLEKSRRGLVIPIKKLLSVFKIIVKIWPFWKNQGEFW